MHVNRLCALPSHHHRRALISDSLTDMKYHCGLLGDDLDTKKYSALILKGEELSELEFLANSGTKDLSNSLLFVFLESLITVSSFYIFLLREDEVIKEWHTIERKEELKAVLCKSLSWTTPKDIVILKIK